jgi:hypothetical protein
MLLYENALASVSQDPTLMEKQIDQIFAAGEHYAQVCKMDLIKKRKDVSELHKLILLFIAEGGDPLPEEETLELANKYIDRYPEFNLYLIHNFDAIDKCLKWMNGYYAEYFGNGKKMTKGLITTMLAIHQEVIKDIVKEIVCQDIMTSLDDTMDGSSSD